MAFDFRAPRRVALLSMALLISGGTIADDGDSRSVRARLSGFQEVPVVSTAGGGSFKGKVSKAGDMIEYEFSYRGMQGVVTQAHIHLGQRGVNGGIMVWLCQSATNPAPAAVATVPVCTSPEGVFSGVIVAGSIVGPGGAQQLGAGEFGELLAALRAGVAYVNVHTTLSPGGEIRGQLDNDHRH